MASKNGKIQRIEQMKDMLRLGMDRAAILQELSKTCKLSDRTLDAELKVARQAIGNEMAAKEEIRQTNLSEQLKTE